MKGSGGREVLSSTCSGGVQEVQSMKGLGHLLRVGQQWSSGVFGQVGGEGVWAGGRGPLGVQHLEGKGSRRSSRGSRRSSRSKTLPRAWNMARPWSLPPILESEEAEALGCLLALLPVLELARVFWKTEE